MINSRSQTCRKLAELIFFLLAVARERQRVE